MNRGLDFLRQEIQVDIINTDGNEESKNEIDIGWGDENKL